MPGAPGDGAAHAGATNSSEECCGEQDDALHLDPPRLAERRTLLPRRYSVRRPSGLMVRNSTGRLAAVTSTTTAAPTATIASTSSQATWTPVPTIRSRTAPRPPAAAARGSPRRGTPCPRRPRAASDQAVRALQRDDVAGLRARLALAVDRRGARPACAASRPGAAAARRSRGRRARGRAGRTGRRSRTRSAAARCARRRTCADSSLPVVDDRAGVRRDDAGDAVQQRRLARARRPHDRHDLAGGDVELGAGERRRCAP